MKNCPFSKGHTTTVSSVHRENQKCKGFSGEMIIVVLVLGKLCVPPPCLQIWIRLGQDLNNVFYIKHFLLFAQNAQIQVCFDSISHPDFVPPKTVFAS